MNKLPRNFLFYFFTAILSVLVILRLIRDSLWFDIGMTVMASIILADYFVSMRTLQRDLDRLREAFTEWSAEDDTRQEATRLYREGLIDYAARAPFDSTKPQAWRDGWSLGELTVHNRLSAVQDTAPSLPDYELNPDQLAALWIALSMAKEQPHWVRAHCVTVPAPTIATFQATITQLEKMLDPLSGLAARIAVATKAGFDFAIMKESTKPPRLVYDFVPGSHLDGLDKLSMETINEGIAAKAGIEPLPRRVSLHVPGEKLAKIIANGRINDGLNIVLFLNDDGLLLDVMDGECRQIDSVTKCYANLGVTVRRAVEPATPPVTEFRVVVPVYNGSLYPDEVAAGTKPEWTEPTHPVLVREQQGLRIILGSHDYDAEAVADICIERQPNAWVIFLHPMSGLDPVGYIYFFDDGKAAFYEERHFNGQSIEMLLPGSDHPLIDGRRTPAATETKPHDNEGPQL